MSFLNQGWSKTLQDCGSPEPTLATHAKARDTLYDFRLSQMKDWHRETIVAISVIVAPNGALMSYSERGSKTAVVRVLATKDSLHTA